MSLEQVKRVVPGAVTPAEPEQFNDGTKELLRLEDIEIVHRRFRVLFYFKNGKLDQVTLNLKKPEGFDDLLHVFDSLTEVLRSKYGKEIKRDIHRGDISSAGQMNTAEATWLQGQTNINLYSISFGPTSELNVNYQVRLAKEAEKL